MRWTRDEYVALMTKGEFERPMFCELFGPLIGLEDQWRQQGASAEEIALTAFDWDYVRVIGCGGNTHAMGGAKSMVIEDTPVRRVERDYLGRTTVLDKRTATIALPTDFPVKSMDDWLKLKPMFEWREDRINWQQVERAKQARQTGALVTAGIPGAFDTARELMGEEVACMAYYDQPGLMADVIGTIHATSMRVLEQVSEHVQIDQLSVHEDLAGRSGPMVGPVQVKEYFQPYFSEVWRMLRSRGAVMFAMDTDGNVNAIMDDLLASGLTEVYPMEPAAGMDVVKLREKYGKRLAFRGGIDKHALRKDKAAIRAELEYKLQPIMRDFGFAVFALDHRIPQDVPIENYRYYVELGCEMLGIKRTGSGWRRMAF